MTVNSKPDVPSLMKQIRQAATEIDAEPPARSRVDALPPVPALDDNWDVWQPMPISTHRGLVGMPVVWAKKLLRAVLAPHEREVLKRQRDFNRAVKLQMDEMRHSLAELHGELVTLRMKNNKT